MTTLRLSLRVAPGAPVAVLGLSSGENLYTTGTGWAKGVYVPAYVRRFPFCMSRVTIDKVEQRNRLICVEKGHIDDQAGEAVDGEEPA